MTAAGYNERGLGGVAGSGSESAEDEGTWPGGDCGGGEECDGGKEVVEVRAVLVSSTGVAWTDWLPLRRDLSISADFCVVPRLLTRTREAM